MLRVGYHWILVPSKCDGYDYNCETYCMRYGTDGCYFKEDDAQDIEDKEKGGE